MMLLEQLILRNRLEEGPKTLKNQVGQQGEFEPQLPQGALCGFL